MPELKIFGGHSFQDVEEQFNNWKQKNSIKILKTIAKTTPIPKENMRSSLYFTLFIFYKLEETEELVR